MYQVHPTTKESKIINGLGERPIGRRNHCCAAVDNAKAIVIHGGLSSSHKLLGDMWMFYPGKSLSDFFLEKRLWRRRYLKFTKDMRHFYIEGAAPVMLGSPRPISIYGKKTEEREKSEDSDRDSVRSVIEGNQKLLLSHHQAVYIPEGKEYGDLRSSMIIYGGCCVEGSVSSHMWQIKGFQDQRNPDLSICRVKSRGVPPRKRYLFSMCFLLKSNHQPLQFSHIC